MKGSGLPDVNEVFWVRVSRGHAYRDGGVAYKLLIDGIEVGNVRDRRQLDIEVTPGRHRAQMRVWRRKRSPEVDFDIAPGGTAILECGPGGSSLAGLTDAILTPDRYISLRLVESGRPRGEVPN